MASGNLLPAGKAHLMRTGDGRPLLDKLGAGADEILPIGVAEPADLLVLGADEGGPVERGLADPPTETRRVAEVVGEAAGVDVKLLRHAAPDDARAADAAFLGDERLGAMAGGDARRPHAARSCADDKKIDVESHGFDALCRARRGQS